MYMIVIGLFIVLIIWRRVSATRKPIQGTGIKILWPMLFLLPGIGGFSDPRVELQGIAVLAAIGLGLLMSIPLIFSTNYEVREDKKIYAKRSVAFVVSLIVLAAIRFALRDLLHEYNSSTMMMLFFVVGVSYVVPWRIASFVKFRRVLKGSNVLLKSGRDGKSGAGAGASLI